jgi:hypothetical protein
MRAIVESVRGPQLDWEKAYGPVDGPWLRAEFEHITSELGHIESIRIARMDDEVEMARYREQSAASSHACGDWEVTSGTGVRYMMGCVWRDDE